MPHIQYRKVTQMLLDRYPVHPTNPLNPVYKNRIPTKILSFAPMDKFLEYAENLIIYRIRSAWLEISKLYNELAAREGATLPMGLTLLTIHPTQGTPVTKIAPRMGMEPNSLSRLLNSLEQKGFVTRERDSIDKRKVYVRLTEKGREKRAYAFDRVLVLNEKILRDIEPEKIAAFFEVIDTLQESVGMMRAELDQKA